MNAKRFIILLSALCVISIIVFAKNLSKYNTAMNELSTNANNESANNSDDYQNSTTTEAKATATEAAEAPTTEFVFPDSHSINVNMVYQYPELPSGCESVSLTMLLNFYGFDITKTELVNNYLVYANDFVNGFFGDPYDSAVGGGCYAPGMTTTANKYLSTKNTPLKAVNVSGSSFDDLLTYVAKDTPVMIWTTISLQSPEKGYPDAWYDGKQYMWDYMEHCVVLTGYDKTNNTVTVNDPIEGTVTRNLDTFSNMYDEMYKMAIVIK